MSTAQGLRCIPVCFGECNVEVSCTLRNILGNAEKLQGNKSLGHKTLNSFKLEATHPLEFGSTARLNVSAFQTLANLVKHRCGAPAVNPRRHRCHRAARSTSGSEASS